MLSSLPPEKSPIPVVTPAMRIAVSRFVSSFSATFRSFYLYQQDNRAFEEIMQNLARRFQETIPAGQSLKLTITNRSFIYEDEPVGFKEVTAALSGQLRALGYKEIHFLSPVQNRNFFQLLHILSLKESEESKNEKLIGLLYDGEPKPIGLVPITANSTATRLSDQLIMHRLTPLSIPENMEGSGFVEKMSDLQFDSLPDLYNWICQRIEKVPPAVKSFAINITDATREGYFPLERFLRLFPLARKVRDEFRRRVEIQPSLRPRKQTPLGHRLLKTGKKTSTFSPDWASLMVAFSDEETKKMQSYRAQVASLAGAQDLELAHAFLQEPGPNFIFGLSLLLRHMTDKNPIAVQEKALKIAIDIWSKHQSNQDDINLVSLLSSLRQSLTLPQNIVLALYPIRNATLDSLEFRNTAQYLLSLGKAVLPGLVNALEVEQDRGMRKKLCELITVVSKEFGIDALVATLPKASPFLLRNLVMVLGDIRHPLTVSDLIPLLRHNQKMVRVEAVKSLCKIGSEEVFKPLLSTLEQSADIEARHMAIEFFNHRKYTPALDVMMRLAKHPTSTSPLRRSLYTAISNIGGPIARQFLEQIQREGSFMTRFSAEQKEDIEFVKNLLSRMPS